MVRPESFFTLHFAYFLCKYARIVFLAVPVQVFLHEYKITPFFT